MENLGRVIGFENYKIYDDGTIENKKGKKRIPAIDRHGYLRLCLWSGGYQKNFYVHRLVAMVFIPNPDNNPIVNHIDGDKLNNNVENLEWTTMSGNAKHSFESLGRAQHNAIQVVVTNKKSGKVEIFKSTSDACRKLGINQPYASKVLATGRVYGIDCKEDVDFTMEVRRE